MPDGTQAPSRDPTFLGPARPQLPPPVPPARHLPSLLSGWGAGWGSWLSSLLKFFFKHSREWPAEDKLPGERPSKKTL